MSEYQYYEFQAIDRSLTKNEMGELRKLSSRATISARKFSNVYHFGDFRGNPARLMEQYFDAFLYLAKWGSRELMFRLPSRAIDLASVKQFCQSDCISARTQDDFVILRIQSNPEDEDSDNSWIDDDEVSAWLSALVPLRADIAKGDTRALYLAWLLCAQSGMLDDETSEPPVPANLGKLTPPLEVFVQFFGIDDDLVAVAAQRSPAQEEIPVDEFGDWVADLSDAAKTDLLVRCGTLGGVEVQAELIRLFSASKKTPNGECAPNPRTVRELLESAKI